MDTSTSCNSTSTSAPVRLDLRLLDRCSLSALTLVDSVDFDCTRYYGWVPLGALSWRGVYLCKSRCTRTRVQFKNPHSGEHCREHFGCVRTHFQPFMNQAESFFLRWSSEIRKKTFRRNFRKCSRMRTNLFNFFI